MLKKNYNVLIGIIVLLLYFIWPYLLNAILNILHLEGVLSLTINLILNFVLLGIIIYIFRESLKVDFKNFKKNISKNLKQGFIIFLCGFFIYGLVNSLICEIFPNIDNVNYDAMSQIFSETPILLFISTIFYYPVIEELVFKKTFADIIKNKWIFVIFTGILNAVFEIFLIASTNSMYLILVVPISLFYMSFSYMYYKTKSVFTPIFFRMIYNIIPSIGNIIITYLLIK